MKGRNRIPHDLKKDGDDWRFTGRVAVTRFADRCGQFAQLLQHSQRSEPNKCDTLTSPHIGLDIMPCKRCGSPARAGDGFCLNCVLEQGLDFDSENAAIWDEVLEEVSIGPARWRIGNYQILQQIGRGGMGVIYRARVKSSTCIVALKRILSVHAESREMLARFRREAAIVAALSHPNILPIYELGETEEGLPFFTMKYAGGGSLLETSRALRNDPRRIIRLMAKVSRAVHHAHLQGVLHRDLKPGNILLDGHGEPLVSDFGLAKSLDTTSDLTRTLTSFGTPGFIAPEQAEGPARNLTSAADIYSIGAVLFYLLAGRPPFVGENALTVIKEATEKPAPRLRTFTPTLDRDLEIICAKCLEREPQARYRSVADLAEDLECWLEARPITARRVMMPVRIWRWSKRKPTFAGALAAIIVLGTLNIVAAFTIWYLLSIVEHARLTSHRVAIARFHQLRELAATLNSVAESRSAVRTDATKIDAAERSTEQAENDSADSAAVSEANR
jgi:eukaryotic-like serine/threonine-protein kinase